MGKDIIIKLPKLIGPYNSSNFAIQILLTRLYDAKEWIGQNKSLLNENRLSLAAFDGNLCSRFYVFVFVFFFILFLFVVRMKLNINLHNYRSPFSLYLIQK